MKILYAIQGTGNGHISRAKEIIPVLKQYGEVDILVSGTQVDLSVNNSLQYRFRGVSFIFGKKGGVHRWKTYQSMNMAQFYRDMKSLPLKDYHLIINDFEPVCAWACRLQQVDSVALSHQCAFVSPNTPRPLKKWNWEEFIFTYYAPTKYHVGLHFESYDDFIFTPIIRSDIREAVSRNLGHYTVYLPAYDDVRLMTYLRQIPEISWEIFSKHQVTPYRYGNVQIKPIAADSFTQSLVDCEGVITGGGFETPAEALFLGKKLLVIPMKYQYEQQCNAIALQRLGIPSLATVGQHFVAEIRHWMMSDNVKKISFPNRTEYLIKRLISDYAKN